MLLIIIEKIYPVPNIQLMLLINLLKILNNQKLKQLISDLIKEKKYWRALVIIIITLSLIKVIFFKIKYRKVNLIPLSERNSPYNFKSFSIP